MNFIFKILGSVNKTDGIRPVIAEVFVSEDCIAEYRKSAEESGVYLVLDEDRDIANSIFEDRYESALNNAGYTYEQAQEGGFDVEESAH